MVGIFGPGTKKAFKKVKMAQKGLKPYEFGYGTVWATSKKKAKKKLDRELKKKYGKKRR